VVPIEEEPCHRLVIANEFVRAFMVEIAPHDRTLCHHHPTDYLLYVVGDADIISAARDEEPKKLSYRDGECELSDAGLVHVVENLGETPFRNVVVELLPSASTLRRGAAPVVVKGEACATIKFEDERASIYTVDLGCDGQVRVETPVLMVTLSKGTMRLPGREGTPVMIDQFNEFMWVPARQTGALQNPVGVPIRMVLFQVGPVDEELGMSKLCEPPKNLRAHADRPE
jgi:hypothetical protein